MAVPKRKTSKSKRNMRRSQKGLKPVCYGFNQTTGEITMPHRVSLDGFYKGKQIILKKINSQNNEETEENRSAE